MTEVFQLKCCRACGFDLVDGRCIDCGWESDARGKTKKAPRNIEVVHRDYISDELIQSEKERIAELRSEHPGNWQEILMREARAAFTPPDTTPERRKKAAEFSAALREQVPLLNDTADVCRSMPAPWDKEGMAIYKQKLLRLQGLLPTREAVEDVR